MHVRLEPLRIDGETVHFRWEQSAPNPFQTANEFWFRYEEIDLERFSSHVFWEIFLALQLKVFAAYGEPVEIEFPVPLPRHTVEFWLAFHDADRVLIGPQADTTACSPRRAGQQSSSSRRRVGIHFGGGKDSMLAACLFGELYGRDQILLIQGIGPIRPGDELAQLIETRQERLMLAPAREQLGFPTQRIWTNYQENFLPSANRQRPHLELYTVGSLPAMLNAGITTTTFSSPWLLYLQQRTPRGAIYFRYAKSRPEMLHDLSDHYRRAFGIDLDVLNINMLFSTYGAFRVLRERYPDAFARIVMCSVGEVDERWCYDCKKCAEYAFFSLAQSYVDPEFDYDRLFARSPFITEIVNHADSGVELPGAGNADWPISLGGQTNRMVFAHALAMIDPMLLAGRISARALANLVTVLTLFGNEPRPALERIPASVIDLIGHHDARRIAAIAAQHLAVEDGPSGPWMLDGKEVQYDFSLRMETKTREVLNSQSGTRSARNQATR